MRGLLLACLALYVQNGLSSPIDNHIIGGKVSEKGRWPWLVSLVRLRPDEGEDVFRHTCGGALLTPTYVLTAAHCVQYPLSHYKILVGAFSQVQQDQEDTILPKRLVPHEDYVAGSGYPNDIAVIELERPADISNEFVGLGKLPRRGEEFAGNQDCWIAGWGRINPDPANWTAADELREVNTEVHTLQECRKIWEDHTGRPNNNILDQHVCVGLPDLGACHGDSGSPAVCDATGQGDWVMIGLNSWGTGSRCAAATNAFASTVYFLDWIAEHVPGLPGAKP